MGGLLTQSQIFMEIVKPVHRALAKDFYIRLHLFHKLEKKGLNLGWLIVCTFRVFSPPREIHDLTGLL